LTGEEQRGERKKERKTLKPCDGSFVNLWNGTLINDDNFFSIKSHFIEVLLITMLNKYLLPLKKSETKLCAGIPSERNTFVHLLEHPGTSSLQ